MPNHMPWDPAYSVGNGTLDAQHRQILAQCAALAGADRQPGAAFDSRFSALMALAEEHFATEETLLSQNGYPAIDELQGERKEFSDLLNDIVTTEHFNPDELQRFLGLWWIGHIVGSGKKIRAFLEPLVP